MAMIVGMCGANREGLALAATGFRSLACLRDCGRVDWRPVGRQSFYFLTRTELVNLLRSAEAVLSATGEAVDLCPTYGSRPGRRS